MQYAPNGSALFIHRISSHKYNPTVEELNPIELVTNPSCRYFQEKGWNPDKIAGDHTLDPPFGIINHAMSGERAGCNYTMHALHQASLLCGGYNSRSSSGDSLLPVFQVRKNLNTISSYHSRNHCLMLVRFLISSRYLKTLMLGRHCVSRIIASKFCLKRKENIQIFSRDIYTGKNPV